MKKEINNFNGKKIIFDDQHHTYSIEGIGKLPSVSEIVGTIFPFPSQAEQEAKNIVEIIKLASVRGATFHKYMDEYIKTNKMPLITEMDLMIYVEKAIAVLEKLKIKSCKSEQRGFLFNENLNFGFAGTWDVEGILENGKTFRIDWKTNKSIVGAKYKGYELQMMLYNKIKSVDLNYLIWYDQSNSDWVIYQIDLPDNLVSSILNLYLWKKTRIKKNIWGD